MLQFCEPKRKSLNRFKMLISLLGLLLIGHIDCGQLAAQVGKETSLWNWSVASSHHESIVQIESDGGFGTGVIVRVDKDKPVGDGYEGFCLTAWHVVDGDDDRREIRIEYRNGIGAKKCKVVAKDEANDIALLWVWVPDDIPAATLATLPVKAGDELEIGGLGGGSALQCCLRHFRAKASVATNSKQLFADVPLLPGDSGGPVFNSRKELVGIVSGGWFWLDAGVKKESGESINVTWPARAGNLNSIQLVIDNANPDGDQIAAN